jgi:hypothetical protein
MYVHYKKIWNGRGKYLRLEAEITKKSSDGKYANSGIFVETINPLLTPSLTQAYPKHTPCLVHAECSVSQWRPQKVDKRMVLEHTHGLFIT